VAYWSRINQLHTCAIAWLVVVSAAQAADCTIFDTLDGFATTGTPPPEATCSTYRTQASTTGTSCFWSHPYRGAAVPHIAADLWQSLTICRPGQILPQDSQVNHPDSYDLREWAHGADNYALSVKDKAALNRTLIFLRFEPST
jgi:hypothetical protein